MEENIKEYLNINAPKYAEFKGYDESFINEVKDFTEGASPTDLVQLFYDEAISKLKEGGLIPKFLNGSAGVSSADREKDLRGSWRDEVFSKLQQELFNKLKLGLEGKEGGITMELFNDYQSKHANIYNRIKGTDFYTKAYRPEKKGEVSELLGRYLNHEFNDLAIKPNWESRYHINSNNPNSGDNPLEWTTDDLYSAITDDRRFGRDGDFTNPQHLEDWLKLLKEIGYKYELDGDGYYKLSRINPENQELGTKPGNQEKVTPPVQTKSDLQATVPTIGKKSFGEGIWNGVLKGVPHAIEALKFLDAYRTNKRMYEHALKNYTWAPMAFTPKHLNIYGDLAALNLGYNNAADVQSQAARIGNNTVDYRTAAAINLQGNSNANKIRTEAGTKFNDLARSTSEKATTQEFDNIDKLQEAANENRNRFAAYLNALLTNDLGYMNQLHMNKTNLFNHYEETAMYKNQDNKESRAEVLQAQMQARMNNDKTLGQLELNYRANPTEANYNAYYEYKTKLSKILNQKYQEELARLRGIRFKDSPFDSVQVAKDGGKVSDDGPVRRRRYDLERRRKERRDKNHLNDKGLERLGRLTYLWAKRAQGK